MNSFYFQAYITAANLLGLILISVSLTRRQRSLTSAAQAAGAVLSLLGAPAGVLAAALLCGSRRDGRVMSLRLVSACLVILEVSALLLVDKIRAGALSFDVPGFFALHGWFPAYLAAINAAAFALYGADKRSAVRGGPRVRESVLLGAAFAGGCVGAAAAVLVFRHKTRKRYFLPGLLLVAAADIAAALVVINLL